VFEVLVIVCATGLNLEVYLDSCFEFKDSWGPYNTLENCNIRQEQIVGDILYGDLQEPTFTLLRYPPFIYAEGMCIKTSNEIES
jgi:hypothetical protein